MKKICLSFVILFVTFTIFSQTAPTLHLTASSMSVTPCSDVDFTATCINNSGVSGIMTLTIDAFTPSRSITYIPPGSTTSITVATPTTINFGFTAVGITRTITFTVATSCTDIIDGNTVVNRSITPRCTLNVAGAPSTIASRDRCTNNIRQFIQSKYRQYDCGKPYRSYSYKKSNFRKCRRLSQL